VLWHAKLKGYACEKAVINDCKVSEQLIEATYKSPQRSGEAATGAAISLTLPPHPKKSLAIVCENKILKSG
jgi:hypothetical protein